MPYPPGSWLVEVAIEARSRDDGVRLLAAFAVLGEKDRALTVLQDHDSAQTILCGASEEHLRQTVEILSTDYELDLNVGAPQVAYRETITRVAEIDHTYSRLEGAAGQFARVKIRFEPGEEASGFVFENGTSGDAVPEVFIPGVKKGLASAREQGLFAGFPVIDFKATLYDGAYHDLDSSA
jgi:elongation factor G